MSGLFGRFILILAARLMLEKGKEAADICDAFKFQAEDSDNGRKKSAAGPAPAGNCGREPT